MFPFHRSFGHGIERLAGCCVGLHATHPGTGCRLGSLLRLQDNVPHLQVLGAGFAQADGPRHVRTVSIQHAADVYDDWLAWLDGMLQDLTAT